MQTAAQMGNIEEKLGNIEETRRLNIHLIRVSKREEEESGTEAILEWLRMLQNWWKTST